MRLRNQSTALGAACRRATVLAAAAALTVASAAVPGWAETLRHEGYYVDLALDLLRPNGHVVAGSHSPLSARVSNRGPDSAQRPWLLLSPDEGITIAADDCSPTASNGLHCELEAIAPGHEQHVGAMLAFHPDARGILLVAGAAGSERLDVGPGDEIDATWFELRGQHSLRVTPVNSVPARAPGHRLQWTFVVDNAGPSSALSLLTMLDVWPDDPTASIRCRGDGGARCATDQAHAYLPPHGRLWYDFDVAADEHDHVAVMIGVHANEGENTGPGPLWSSATWQAGVFGDGFE